MASASSEGSGSGPTGAVANAPSSYELFYNQPIGQAYTADQLWGLFGINIQTVSIEVLNYQGFYPVVETPITANTSLYTAAPVYTIDGEIANETWIYTARPLDQAKENGQSEVKAASKQEVEDINATYGLNAFSFAGIASQSVPPARYQEVLDAVTAVTDTLDSNLTIIETATDVETINNVVSQPFGTLNTGRGGPGQLGPLDLNLSYFSSIESLPGFTQADLELYVPGTDTVISYDAGLPAPFVFDSQGNCFTTGDYRLVIRYAGGGAVISTIIVPEGANTNVAWTYNPVIPALSGGGSSSVSE